MEPVDPELYRNSMENRWSEFGQIKADGMDKNWLIFAGTMNKIIKDNYISKNSTAYIVPMATGESKTQGSIVYCSLLPEGTKAMMIVERNDAAEQIANQINDICGDAVPYNSEVDIEIEVASTHQTVIVSHEFFKRNGYKNNKKWEILTQDRDLFIIDEALHSVNSMTLNRRELEALRWSAKSLKQSDAVAIIELHIQVIDDIKVDELKGFAQLNTFDQDRPYDTKMVDEICSDWENVDKLLITRAAVFDRNSEVINNFIAILKTEPFTNAISCKARGIRQYHLESFYRKEDLMLCEGLKIIMSTSAFATKKMESITGVKELVPGGISFAVLDATAPVNDIYKLQEQFKGNTVMVPVARTRNYNGFTIKCGRTLTGKSSLDKDSISEMCNTVASEFEAGDKILFVTHKSNKVFITRWKDTLETKDVEIEVEHYGNITGKNDWRDFNKISLIGLPHKPTEFYQSLNIVKTDEDLAYEEEGKQNHTSIAYTDLASDMVQAVARIRVRNIANKDGGCLPATAYITLNQNTALFNTLENALTQQFPGSDILEWKLPETISKAKQLPMGFESTLQYLEDRLTVVGADIDIFEPRDVLDIHRKAYSRLLNNQTFLEQVKHMGIEIQERRVKDKRGRMKRRPSKFFARVEEEIKEFN